MEHTKRLYQKHDFDKPLKDTTTIHREFPWPFRISYKNSPCTLSTTKILSNTWTRQYCLGVNMFWDLQFLCHSTTAFNLFSQSYSSRNPLPTLCKKLPTFNTSFYKGKNTWEFFPRSRKERLLHNYKTLRICRQRKKFRKAMNDFVSLTVAKKIFSDTVFEKIFFAYKVHGEAEHKTLDKIKSTLTMSLTF